MSLTADVDMSEGTGTESETAEAGEELSSPSCKGAAACDGTNDLDMLRARYCRSPTDDVYDEPALSAAKISRSVANSQSQSADLFADGVPPDRRLRMKAG